jgi:hypothetical protein
MPCVAIVTYVKKENKIFCDFQGLVLTQTQNIKNIIMHFIRQTGFSTFFMLLHAM